MKSLRNMVVIIVRSRLARDIVSAALDVLLRTLASKKTKQQQRQPK